jgi:hypothetical protein
MYNDIFIKNNDLHLLLKRMLMNYTLLKFKYHMKNDSDKIFRNNIIKRNKCLPRYNFLEFQNCFDITFFYNNNIIKIL